MVTTVIELSATDRQANDDIIARLDSLIVAAASQETLLTAMSTALDDMLINQNLSNQVAVEMKDKQGHQDEHLALAAIAGADSLIVHLKRILFENPNEVDRQRLRFMEGKYEALIDEAHIDEA